MIVWSEKVIDLWYWGWNKYWAFRRYFDIDDSLFETFNWTSREMLHADPDNFPPKDPYAVGIWEAEQDFMSLIILGKL